MAPDPDPVSDLDPYGYVDDTVPWAGRAAVVVGAVAVTAGVLLTAAAVAIADRLLRRNRR